MQHEIVQYLKKVQHEMKCKIKIVQYEESATWEKCNIKKCNMKRLQHKKTTRKWFSMEKVQNQKSIDYQSEICKRARRGQE